jgi:hypothetical protein
MHAGTVLASQPGRGAGCRRRNALKALGNGPAFASLFGQVMTRLGDTGGEDFTT